MLRYFYLLCLLICIDWSFCYEYISEQRPLRQRGKDMRAKRQRHRVRTRKDYDNFNKDSLAHIDVASFIQQPDYDAVENNYYKPHSQRRQKESNYDNLIALGSLSGMNHVPEIHESQRYDHDGAGYKSNGLHQEDLFYETTRAPVEKARQRHPKKCSVKQMKFPFFSHKKSSTPKLKKAKKKKMRTSSTMTTTLTSVQPSPLPKTRQEALALYRYNNKMKRSYEENYCPLCKRKFMPRRKSNSKKKKVLHNSRQFYQDAEEKARAMLHRGYQNEATERWKLDAQTQGRKRKKRRKRDEKTDERDRQLKELEEVQKKVDGMEIQGATLPNQKGSQDKERGEKEKG